MSLNKNMISYIKGVSLVELAIVVAIIGFLISGILGGLYIVKSAQLRKTITEFNRIQTAISAFENEYGYLPGDIPNISSYYSVGNGDGDGSVEFSETTDATPKEDLLSWLHLKVTGYYTGDYTGTNVSSTARYGFDKNIPKSASYTKAGYMFRTEADSGGNNIYDTVGTTIRLGSLVDISGTSRSYPTGGVMLSKDAYAIDSKMDDGKAGSGKLYTIREIKQGGSSGCTTDVWSASTADYDLSDAVNETCSLVFWFKKN